MNKIQKAMNGFLFTLATKIFSVIKINLITGSYALSLSGSTLLSPLAGAFMGITGSIIVLCTRIVLHAFLYKSFSLSFLALCIPGFCASLYWATKSSIFRLFLTLMWILLFIIHPIGNDAALYSLYWLIPALLYFVPKKSLYLDALGSTFVAHAVGSVIWLYTIPMTATMWLSLIPVVACERFLITCGMIIAHKTITKGINIINTLTQIKTTPVTQ